MVQRLFQLMGTKCDDVTVNQCILGNAGSTDFGARHIGGPKGWGMLKQCHAHGGKMKSLRDALKIKSFLLSSSLYNDVSFEGPQPASSS